jgi:hypothetical protein
MYRIDNADAVTTMPTVLAPGPVSRGFFQSGNPATGQLATIVDRDWANSIQEEIIKVIEVAGLTLDKADMTQLWQALQRLFPPYVPPVPVNGSQVFTADGTFTFPAGVNAINVEAWGAGGSSCAGHAAGGLASGGAGAGGYAFRRVIGVTPGTVVPVSIGVPGSPGTTASLPTVGTATTFAGLISISAPPDNAAWTLTDPTASGGPGSASGGDLNLTGSWGSAAVASTNGAGNIGGSGGAAPRGGGAVAGNVGTAPNGSTPGGGAAGVGPGVTVGQTGGHGMVYLTW